VTLCYPCRRVCKRWQLERGSLPLSLSLGMEFLAKVHAGHCGISLWSNRMLFSGHQGALLLVAGLCPDKALAVRTSTCLLPVSKSSASKQTSSTS
jgi:hypothetical protein